MYIYECLAFVIRTMAQSGATRRNTQVVPAISDRKKVAFTITERIENPGKLSCVFRAIEPNNERRLMQLGKSRSYQNYGR